LAGAIDAMLPGVRITEVLHEVSRETGFSAAFTNLHTGETCDNENALLAAELGDQVGLQFRPAAFQLRFRTVRIRPLGWREPVSNLSVPRHFVARISSEGEISSRNRLFM
jgi:hypothetical protein